MQKLVQFYSKVTYIFMTFEEMQLIMQSIAVNQLALQTTHSDMQAIQSEMQANQREIQATMQETQLLAQSIARGVQAMQDKALSDELKRDEEKAEHQAQMAELRHISQGLVNMLDSIDSDRPTILRKLNTIEDKADTIIERLSRE